MVTGKRTLKCNKNISIFLKTNTKINKIEDLHIKKETRDDILLEIHLHTQSIGVCVCVCVNPAGYNRQPRGEENCLDEDK